MPVISVYVRSLGGRREAKEIISHLARDHPDTVHADCYDNLNIFPAIANKSSYCILTAAGIVDFNLGNQRLPG